ncbi:DUF1707 and DUF4190 domain-containing protein [Streptomyces sp. NPDC005438]|uniref:DUF1707 and DUF4190 domain-containing protein n=1 Tax=Streptomyces sp. NPDC005438 TaxID=3156880 RepID=UPI0033B2FBAF
MLASEADRERTSDVLRAGYAEGRLSQHEFDRRTSLVLKATTVEELKHLVGDLPKGPGTVTRAPAAHGHYGPPMGYGPPMAPHPQMHMPPMAPAPPVNGNAMAALICGILGFATGLTAIPAVILGHMARAEIRRTGQPGDGHAVAGLVMGWLVIGFGLLFVLFFFMLFAAISHTP